MSGGDRARTGGLRRTSDGQAAAVLVVDDSADNRELLARRLSLRGFAVETAAGGEEALAAIAAGTPQLVLLDVTMPGLGGIEVLERIRRDRSETALPVVMVSARTDSAVVVEALARGANDFVTKPVDFPVLIARIERQLSLRDRAGAAAAAVSDMRAPLGIDDAPRPGSVVDGRYLLEQRLGAGSFGVVWRARHLDLDVPVAVKLLRGELASAPDARARFRREGISAFRLRHPHAVTVLDFSPGERGPPYLVMELLEGRSLDEELRRRGRLPAARATALLAPVADVLAAAHAADVVHRDVKPSNIFIDRRGDGGAHDGGAGERVKVLDFGLAKLVSGAGAADRLTGSGAVLGTPAYVAPERLRGQPYDGRSDVYALGVTLYQALCGRLPFIAPDGDPLAVVTMHLHDPPPPPRAFCLAVPETIERLVLWALRKHPADRPTAAELAALLAEAARTAPPAAEATDDGPAREISPADPADEDTLRPPPR